MKKQNALPNSRYYSGDEYNEKVSVIGSVGKSLATQSRPNDTNAYLANDVVGQIPASNLVFTNVISEAGKQFIISSVSLEIDVNTIPAGMYGFRLHLYDSAPTAIADNVPFDLVAGDRGKYVGNVMLNSPVDLGSTLWSQTDNVNLSGKLANGSTTLYGILETISAYTPSAQIVYKVAIYSIPV